MQPNRRSFLRGILLAAVAPSLLLPKFKDGHKWKSTEMLYIPNESSIDGPEWCSVSFENISSRFYLGPKRLISREEYLETMKKQRALLPLEVEPNTKDVGEWLRSKGHKPDDPERVWLQSNLLSNNQFGRHKPSWRQNFQHGKWHAGPREVVTIGIACRIQRNDTARHEFSFPDWA